MKIIHSGEDEGGWSDEDKQKYRYYQVFNYENYHFHSTIYTIH